MSHRVSVRFVGLVAGVALLSSAVPVAGQAGCVLLRGGCSPAAQTSQCFPDAAGPASWTDPSRGRTVQTRFGPQSESSICHEPVGTGERPRCCTALHPPASATPQVGLRISGTRVFVDYEAPDYYCQNTGDWPPFFTCTNDPLASSDSLLLLRGSSDVLARAFPYYESGTWDTGIDLPCGEAEELTARLSFLASAPAGLVEALDTRLVTAVCRDRRSCPAGGGGASTAVGQPVNAGSGDVSVHLPLFTIAQAPLSLSFFLTYHSGLPEHPELVEEPLGPGWTHPFAQTLRPTDPSGRFLALLSAEGYESTFIRQGDGLWTAFEPGELRGRVVRQGDRLDLVDLDGTVTSFDAATGRWRSTTDRWGNALTGSFDGTGRLSAVADSEGRRIELRYTGGLLSTVELPDGQLWRFEHDGPRLARVFDPLHPGALPWRSFAYQADGQGIERLLAEVRDEAGALLEGHDYDALDRGITSVSDGGRDLVTLAYDMPARGQTTVTHSIDGATQQVSVFHLLHQRGRFLPARIEGSCPTCGGAASDDQTFTWDGSNLAASRTDGLGHVTLYEHDAQANLVEVTEAAGTAEERTVRYAYEDAAWPRFRTAIDEPSVVRPGERKVRRMEWQAGETLLVTTETGWIAAGDPAPVTYTRSTAFDARHRPVLTDGPRTDVADRSTFAYFADDDPEPNRRGRLRSSTDPAGLTTTQGDYDLYGTPRTSVDPNGVVSRRTTDARGRVTARTERGVPGEAGEEADYTTAHVYDGRDRLVRTLHPRGNGRRSIYEDGTGRLLAEIRLDAAGKERERRHRTLNAIGGLVEEELQSCAAPAASCAAWTTRRSESFVWDERNRLREIRHAVPAGAAVRQSWDADGLLAAVQDENHAAPNTLYAYDALHRLRSVRQTLAGAPGGAAVTAYGYDAQDNLTAVTDPNGNTTRYVFDDFRRLVRQESPVTGVTAWEHDPAGNPVRTRDARGAVTTQSWDAAGRLLESVATLAGAATETVRYEYDDPSPGRFGLGRLARMTDPSGSTAYAYERRGLLRREEKTVLGTTYVTAYRYDANGNRSAVVYPSGREVAFSFDFADRPVSASWKTATSGSTPLVTDASYLPFGPAERTVFGNGTVQTFRRDLRYQPVENRLDGAAGPLAAYLYELDPKGNVTAIRDALEPGYDRAFGYDDLDRLTGASTGDALWGEGGYSYDAMGNMTSLALGSHRAASLSYQGTLPKLAGIETEAGRRAVTYDAAGNETSLGGTGASYSARNLLAGADGLVYTYDGRGLRTAVEIATPLSTITGTVVAEADGAPVAGVTVRVLGAAGSATTDGSGAFRLTWPAGLVTLTASAPGFLAGTTPPFSVAPGATFNAGVIRLAPAPVRITGTVFGALDGAPLAGARVTVAPTGAFSDTDQEGRFLLEQPAGSFTLTFSRPGYQSRTLPPFDLAAGTTRRLGEVILDPEPALLTGRAVDGGGAPLAGASVTATAQARRVVTTTATTATTDTAGAFRLSVPPGTWTVTVARDGFGSRTSGAVSAGPGVTHDLGTFTLAALGTVTGRVLRAEDGAPLTGATVAVDGTLSATLTDEAGAFRLTLPPGSWTLNVAAQGFVPLTAPPFTLLAGAAVDLGDLRLTRVELSVHVGYADDLRPTSQFPVPWQGAPNVVYLGSPSPLDAGAVRLDNSTGQPITVDRVIVDLQRPGPVYELWGSFTVPAHGSVILTQTTPFDFDTSDAAIVPCGETPDAADPRVPKVTVEINGETTDFYDTGHVLDTGGFDSFCQGNESLPWRQIGTTGPDTGGAFDLAPVLGTGRLDTPYTLTATVTDAGGQPLPNVTVVFRQTAGPRRGPGGEAVTDAAGRAVFTYSNSVVGTDTWEAAVPNPSGGENVSNLAVVQWPAPVDLELFVGYADTTNPGSTENFPLPWEDAPNTVFRGGGSFLDAGALRLDNPADQPLAVDRVVVDLQRPGPVYDLWGSFTIPAHGAAILTQTRSYDFDTSEETIVPCGGIVAADDPRIPKITITSGGSTFSYLDTGHILDTFGYDLACQGNESLQWRPVGTLDVRANGGLVLLPATTVAPVGSLQTLTAVVTDAAGEPRSNVLVNFHVDSGPNWRLTGQAVSDASGRASFTYSTVPDELNDTDLVRAWIQSRGGITTSNPVTILWLPQVTLALSPAGAALPAGTAHNVTVQATDGAGHPVANLVTTFQITAGPNAGRTLQARTDAAGRALFAWTGEAPGTDVVEATLLLSGGAVQASNPASVEWTAAPRPGTGPKLLLDPASALHATGETATVIATLLDSAQRPEPEAEIAFEIVSGPQAGRTGQGATDAHGRVAFTWTGNAPGIDTLRATASVEETVVSGLAVVEWEALATTLVYTGPTAGEYSDAMVLTARLTESATGQSLANQAVTFTFGARTFTATTGAAGTAEVRLLVEETPGAVPLSVTFPGENGWAGSSATLLAVVTPEDTVLTLAGAPVLASGSPQPVSAQLLDDDGTPLAGKTLVFHLGATTATAVTGPDGTATATLALPAARSGPAHLQITFAGDAFYRSASTSAPVLAAQPTSFVIWGGNTPGLRVGERVQFWGAQWSRQVTGGDYAASADFKGWSKSDQPPHPCQATAHTTGTPRLDATCWTSKPGNSGPPATLADYIQVIVTTGVDQSGSTIYGNIAATVVLQVDRTNPYAPDPGHPGFGTIAAVIEDAAHVFNPPSLATVAKAEPRLTAAASAGPRRYSIYSPEMSLLAETELTTAPHPTILYDYIWFDGRPIAQIDSTGLSTWTFTDHLGTPLLQTSAFQGITWRAEYEPYGLVYALRTYDRHQPLRLPGQEAEQLGAGANGVTDRFYNVHRWYQAGVGRYGQADPAGRRGDAHPYAYAYSSPLSIVDSLGLRSRACCTPIAGGLLKPWKHCFIEVQDDQTGSSTTYSLHGMGTGNREWGGPAGCTFKNDGFDQYASQGNRAECGEWSSDCAPDECVKKEYSLYPKASLYRLRGPNSNTFAGTITRKCGLKPPSIAGSWQTPGWWDSAAPGLYWPMPRGGVSPLQCPGER